MNLRSLKSNDPNVRYRGVLGLDKQGQGSKEVIDGLVEVLKKDKNTNVRVYTVIALGNIGQGSQQAIDVLIGAFKNKDEDLNIRVHAVRALGNIGQGSQQAIDELIEALKDEDPNVRGYAVRALGNIGQESKEVVKALIPFLSDDEYFIRRERVIALGKMKVSSDKVTSGLIRALGDPDKEVQTTAHDALIKHGKSAVPQLIGQFGNISSLNIVDILIDTEEGAVDDLTLALKSDNFIVRGNSAQALGMIIGINGIKVSDKKLNSIITELINIASKDTNRKERDGRIAVIQSLSHFGPRAKEAIPTLQQIVENPRNHISLKQAGKDALNKINQEK